MSELSDYELIREANIARNQNYMQSLGFGLLDTHERITSTRVVKRVRETDTLVPSRRSVRVEKNGRVENAQHLEDNPDLYSVNLSGAIQCNACCLVLQSSPLIPSTKSYRSHQSTCCKKINCIKVNDSIGAKRSEKAPWSDNFNDIIFDGDEDNVDHSLDDAFDGSPVADSDILLAYQSSIAQLYGCNSSVVPFHVRGGRSTSWQQYALIYEFVVNKNLSIHDGDDLIDLLNTMGPLFHRTGSTERQLPKNYVTIHLANDKINASVRKLTKVELPLPVEYFGTTNLRGKPLRPFVGVHFNILERIAEVLLFCDPSHFRSKYEPLKNSVGGRVYSNFESGDCFSKLCKYTSERYGQSVVPICIGIGLDATQINSNKSRSATPVSFVIYNLAGDSERSSFRCEFVGYAPTDYPESVRELKQILLINGCQAEVKQNKIISIARRKAVQDFLFEVLKPIVDTQRGPGLKLQVGSSSNSFEVTVIPFVVAFLGDNEGSNHLLGISSGRKYYRCRICEDKDCSSCNVPPAGHSAESHVLSLRPRLDVKYDRLSTEAALSSQKLLMGKKKDIADDEILRVEECAEFNITPGVNKLYAVAKVTSDAGICGLHEMTPPDHMHTFAKGPKETVMAYAMKVLYRVGELDAKYSHSIGKLDRLIADFDIHVSLPYVKNMISFGTGISKHFPRQILKSDRSTGLVTGGLPTWKYSSMIVQLQLCIGFEESTSLLPTNQHWCRDLSFKGKNVRFTENWCIAAVVHKALSSTIEVMFALGKTEGTNADLVHLDYLIRLNTAHLLQLMDMAKELEHVFKNQPSKNSTSSLPAYVHSRYRGIKLHLMLHFPYYRAFYGMFNFLTDTELLEQAHQLTHLAFQRTSKTFNSNVEEMAIWQGKRIHAARLSERAKHSLGISHLSKHPIVTRTTSFTFAETTQRGRAHSDVLQYDIDHKIYVCISGSLRGLHPMIRLVELTRYLQAYVDNNPYKSGESGDIGTQMILRTQRYCTASTTTLELLYQINCDGNDEIPVSKFILVADRKRKVGSGSHKAASSEYKSRFSFFEAEYQTDADPAVHQDIIHKDIIPVRVMAILKFSTWHYIKNETSKVHYMAFVLRMKQVQGLVNYGPYVNLQYNCEGRSRGQYLDLDIINFSAFHMPACVLQSPHVEDPESVASAFKSHVFYQIPSSRIVSLGAVHSYSSLGDKSPSDEFLNQSELAKVLNLYKLPPSNENEVDVKQGCDQEEEKEDEEHDTSSIENDIRNDDCDDVDDDC